MRYQLIFLTTLSLLAGVSEIQSDNAQPAVELTLANIMRGSDWIGYSPWYVQWSEDGSTLYFYWNPEGEEERSLYAVDRSGGEPRRVSDEERRGRPPQEGDYDEQWRRKVYEANGDLFVMEIGSGRVTQLTNTLERETEPRFVGRQEIAFVAHDNLFRFDLSSGQLEQLTNFTTAGCGQNRPDETTQQEEWLENQQSRLFETLRRQEDRRERKRSAEDADRPDRPEAILIGDQQLSHLRLSPNERFVTFRLEDRPGEVAKASIPQYVTECGFTEVDDGRTKVGAPQADYQTGIYDIERDTVYYVLTDSIPGISDRPEYFLDYPNTDSTQTDEPRPTLILGPHWSESGSHAVVDVRSQDNKDRWLMLLDPATAGLTPLDRQHDEAWIGGPGIHHPGSAGWLDENRFWFQSEATGYSHLYTVDVVTGEKEQLTAGGFEVREVVLARDKKHFYFVSNEVHPGECHFYRLSSQGGRPERITELPGSVMAFLSPDEKKLALLHSTANRPWELYLQDNRRGASAHRITYSLSDEFLAYPWRDPEMVTFTARDSATVHARLYHPKDGTANGAVVFFVHGAGYMQNVCRRWTWYYRETMFHNFLADHGYLVMDIDYRGSAGYGRDWRTGIYRHMGGKDLDDYVDGLQFLEANYDIDPKRVGIYGGSYGGFLTLMALFTEPERFAAGAALRSVTDWAHYNQPYTSNILNLPYTDSLAYAQSSPINFAEGLQGDLLICHGMLDDNVLFQDVVRLAQRLIELGKDNWEMAVYPMEEHTFREPESWTDEYKRIFRLFEENLR